MKVGIIVCGTVAPELPAEFGEFADMIMATLSVHGEFEYQLFNAVEGVLPDIDDSCSGYIITGSTADAYADKPWLHRLARWICLCDQQQKPLFGICFGHQIISIALGGVVEKSSKGWGIGMSVSQLHGKPIWMTPQLETLNLLVSHQDQVIALPPGMSVLASSDFCPYYMLGKGQHLLTIQGHPEFSVEFVRCLVEMKKPLISEALYMQAHESLKNEPDSSTVMRWVANLMQQATD